MCKGQLDEVETLDFSLEIKVAFTNYLFCLTSWKISILPGGKL